MSFFVKGQSGTKPLHFVWGLRFRPRVREYYIRFLILVLSVNESESYYGLKIRFRNDDFFILPEETNVK
jgi:hypothetical protein